MVNRFNLAKDFLRIKVCLCKKCCYLGCKSLASVLIALNSCIDGLIVRGGVGLRGVQSGLNYLSLACRPTRDVRGFCCLVRDLFVKACFCRFKADAGQVLVEPGIDPSPLTRVGIGAEGESNLFSLVVKG